ncbi:MAG: enoyl-CoA hydratase [Thermincola sp.]|nr:enoyl-CoA hydratase [Thermincola sp.]MDT3704572.1 enoyl-CoA hydratase [Thermincola sp.]
MSSIIKEKDDKVLLLRLNREKAFNSLNQELVTELNDVITEVATSGEYKALVITGSDKVFCAGADINDATQANDFVSGYKFSRKYQQLCGRLEQLPIPVIAAISGYALGGGCELALGCDLRIASETAKLGVPEVNIGAFPAGGGTQKLPRLIGATRAKEILFTGRSVGAQEALQIGLVNYVYSVEEYFSKAMELARTLANKPGRALEAIKTLVNNGADMDLTAGLEFESRTFSALTCSEDFSEGTKAFLDKRKPVFKDK